MDLLGREAKQKKHERNETHMKKIIALTLVLLMALGMAGFAKDNADTSPFDFVLTGNSSGYGQTDEWLPSSSLKLTADTSDEESIAVLLSAVLDGSQPLDLALAFEKEKLRFCFPGVTEESYSMRYDALTSMLNDGSESAVPSQQIHASPDSMSEDEKQALVERYQEILLGISNSKNTSKRPGNYALTGLGEKVFCIVVTVKPTQEDWSATLRQLFTTMKEDRQLLDLLEKSANVSAAAAQGQTMPGLMSAGNPAADFQSMLDDALAQTEDLAVSLTGAELEIATGTTRLYALKLKLPDGSCFGYESYGEIKDLRKDALFSYSAVEATLLALCELSKGGGEGSVSIPMLDAQFRYTAGETKDEGTRFDAALSWPGFRADAHIAGPDGARLIGVETDADGKTLELAIQQKKNEAGFRYPDLPDHVIGTTDELKAILDAIGEKVGRTDFALKLAAISGNTQESAPATPVKVPESTSEPVWYAIESEIFYQSNGETSRGENLDPEQERLRLNNSSLSNGSLVLYSFYGDEYQGIIADNKIIWINIPDLYGKVDSLTSVITIDGDKVVLNNFVEAGDDWALDEMTFAPFS